MKRSDPTKRVLLTAVVLMAAALLPLLTLVVQASLERSVMDNGHLMSDVWFQVTLLDAYIGFAIFYAWVAYKERSILARVIWFALIMCLGNIATITYLLIQVVRLPKGQPLTQILLAQAPGSTADG